jgi:hypothetical protein
MKTTTDAKSEIKRAVQYDADTQLRAWAYTIVTSAERLRKEGVSKDTLLSGAHVGLVLLLLMWAGSRDRSDDDIAELLKCTNPNAIALARELIARRPDLFVRKPN